jgi:hypothetical protein
MQGNKTHRAFLNNIEKQGDTPKAGDPHGDPGAGTHAPRHPEARQSDLPVSRHGTNQESQHNKHNRQTQGGHKPQG